MIHGEAEPYTERARVFKRVHPGKRGQPVGSIGVSSYKPQHVQQYQDHLRRAAEEAMVGPDGVVRELITGPVRLTVRVFVKIPASTRNGSDS